MIPCVEKRRLTRGDFLCGDGKGEVRVVEWLSG